MINHISNSHNYNYRINQDEWSILGVWNFDRTLILSWRSRDCHKWSYPNTKHRYSQFLMALHLHNQIKLIFLQKPRDTTRSECIPTSIPTIRSKPLQHSTFLHDFTLQSFDSHSSSWLICFHDFYAPIVRLRLNLLVLNHSVHFLCTILLHIALISRSFSSPKAIIFIFIVFI